LTALFDAGSDLNSARRELIRRLPGLGPKQASLLIRNLCLSDDVAVIDVHVARYLEICHGEHDVVRSSSGIASYERLENKVRAIALKSGSSVGVFDLAVWSTMVALHEVVK
jgi:N-glycosylase/DNA lyase